MLLTFVRAPDANEMRIDANDANDANRRIFIRSIRISFVDSHYSDERKRGAMGDGVLFAERSNELLRVALSKSFGMET